jgi:hypothetical protein
MPDARLIKPLSTEIQTPRDILPKEWADSLKLDYLNSNEQIAEIAARVQIIGKAVYDLQVAVEAIQDALP